MTDRPEGGRPGQDEAGEAMARGSRVAAAGFIFSLLFLLGWLLLRNAPADDAGAEVLLGYYGDATASRGSLAAGLYVIPGACIAFIWFMAALRDRYLHRAMRENTILSTAHVVAGVLVVSSLFILAAVELAAVWLGQANPGESPVQGIRALLSLGEACSSIMALRAAAVFVAVSASRAVRSGVFPRVFGPVSMLLAVVLLFLPQVLPWATLIFPAWVAVASALILVNPRARVGAVPGG
jgi:hypothetical protein